MTVGRDPLQDVASIDLVSARTEDVELGRAALDRLYLAKTKGEAHCPTCGRLREGARVYLSAAIAD